jgi:hypothetical protein
MTDPSLYWQKISAIGQVAGAIATFAAVVVSLWLSLRIQRPRLKLIVGERLLLDAGQIKQRLLVFQIANIGDRTVHVKSFGWRTGRLNWGPMFLRRQQAIQQFITKAPPFELPPFADLSSYTEMATMLQYCRKRANDPFFSRDWPLLGRLSTTILASVNTAEGYTFYARLELATLNKFVEAEIEALNKPSP